MKINSLTKIRTWKGKTVFLRVDFNVPLVKGKVGEDHKILAGLETVKFLADKGARVIVATHLGEPVKAEAAYSVKPVAARLRILLKRPLKFISQLKIAAIAKAAKKMLPGEIIVLENLRFHPGEYENDAAFAKELASLADVYVNEAFAVCHRAQASVAAIKKYLPSYAGLSLEKELLALNKILRPRKPLVIIMGGAKIKTKAPLIARLYDRADTMLIGGALANNFFKFQGREIGQSLLDDDSAATVKKFFKNKKLAAKIMLPSDVIVKTVNGLVRVKSSHDVNEDEIILDIGPETVAAFAAKIKTAQTLVWNGPLGKFEEDSFKHGTLIIARLIASRSSGRAYGVVGGGETVAALKITKLDGYVDWVSAAGGAMLTYLGGGKMPGLTKIVA
jgi:phosphoglycerate kinase